MAQPVSTPAQPQGNGQGPAPVGMVVPTNPAATTYSMASLYVGDLTADVSEALLFEKFSAIGPVLSIRVCRDNSSRLSLGYAYVNFQQPADAERALDTMNYEILSGKPMRIMWSQRDPSARRMGTNNIFIKNLDRNIDNKSIYDTFSLFGNILSCKVATDDGGKSKGYGFVHFEEESAALSAINKVNGMLLSGKKVYVGKFKTRAERLKEIGDISKKFTNVFVKNFGQHLDHDKFVELFSKFGTITSATLMYDEDGKPKGFGFVAYEKPEYAAKAVEEMHEKELEGTDAKLAVCRAQKKSERSSELKKKFDSLKQERAQRYQGVNLYVKNIDESWNDEDLQNHFNDFGTITSAKIMADENGRSKGFGFVCFEKPEEATNAVTEMNSKMVGSKPLYVALAQRKEDRRAQLASQYMQRLATIRNNSGPQAAAIYAGQPGMFVNNPMPAQGRYPQQLPVRAAPQVFQGSQVMVPYPYQNQQRVSYPPNRPLRNEPVRHAYGAYAGQRIGGPPGGRIGQGIQHPMARQQQRGGMQKQYYGNPRHPMQHQHQQPPQQQQTQSGIVISGQEPLTSHMLAQAAPQEQKQLLGERIYALIEKTYPGHKDAGKITGMMLEIDNSELIMMLQDTELFRSKVDEASTVLAKANIESTAQ